MTAILQTHFHTRYTGIHKLAFLLPPDLTTTLQNSPENLFPGLYYYSIFLFFNNPYRDLVASLEVFFPSRVFRLQLIR